MRNRIFPFPVFLVTVWLVQATGGQESQYPSESSDPVIVECNVKPAKDLEISAAESGLLVQLDVKEGNRVEKDQVIGKVDVREAEMQKKAAKFRAAGALKRAKDDINIRFSKKAEEVAQKDYELTVETNKKSKNAVPFIELEKIRLDAERAKLATEKAIHDQELAWFEFHTAKTEHEAAEMAIARREIEAPASGEVVDVFREQGEWVNPGEPILRLVQLDKLEVTGDLPFKEYAASDILGCKVTVKAEVAADHVQPVTGRIVWVSPVPVWNGAYNWEVRAEVDNESVNGDWKLHPGLLAEMTIHLGTANKARAARRSQSTGTAGQASSGTREKKR